MLAEELGWPLLAAIFLIYGLCCIVSIFFAFFLGKYEAIEERLGFNLLSPSIVTPLDLQINFLDNWVKQHNKFIGIILSLFSVFIIVSFARIFIS